MTYQIDSITAQQYFQHISIHTTLHISLSSHFQQVAYKIWTKALTGLHVLLWTQVQVEGVELTGKEKGPVIVDQAKKQKVTLLVLGHRRRPIAWRLLHRWFGRKRSSQSIVDYCIQNADCMTVAVRRKSRRLGGYLITTKRHKNFWLLA